MKSLKILFLILFFVSIVVETAYSIPAFARKYNMTCKTCHSPFPRLKPYGDEFAGNGFVLADQDAPRYFLPTGDDELSLLRDLPLALKLEGYVTYNNSNQSTADFSAPYVVKLLSGGSLTKDVSYYFYFFFSERGEVVGLEDAFIMFNDLFGSDLDVYVGQFQVSDPLFKRELRLTLEDYKAYKLRHGFSKIDLTYDRGIMLTYGLPTGTDLVLEVLNGNGIEAANSFKNFDNDKYKNLMFRLSQDIGGHFRIGGFAYYGNEAINTDTSEAKNEIVSFGGDASVNFDNLVCNFQFLHRNDKNPYGMINSPLGFKANAAFGELIFLPDGDDSKWYAAAIGNYIDSEDNSLDAKSAALQLGYMLRRNIRLFTEFGYDFSRSEKKYGKISAGIISAF